MLLFFSSNPNYDTNISLSSLLPWFLMCEWGGGGGMFKWKYKKGFNLVGLFSFSPPSLFFFRFVPMDLRIYFATKWKLILLFSTLVSNLACSYISATSLIVSSPPRIILFGGPCKDLRCSLTDCFFLRLYLKSIVHKRSSVLEKDIEKNYTAFESQSCFYILKLEVTRY